MYRKSREQQGNRENSKREEDFDLSKYHEIEKLDKRLQEINQEKQARKEKSERIQHRQGRTRKEIEDSVRFNHYILWMIIALICLIGIYSLFN